MIGPASIFSISLKIVIPASLSPFNKVYSIGDAPRHLGSKDTWILMQPYFGKSKIFFGILSP